MAHSEDFTRYLTFYGNKIQNIWPSGEKIYDCFGLCDVLTAFDPGADLDRCNCSICYGQIFHRPVLINMVHKINLKYNFEIFCLLSLFIFQGFILI